MLRKKDSASIGASGFLSFDYIDIEGNIGHINRAEIKTDNTLSPPNFVEMTIYAKENSLTNFQFDYTNNKGEYKILILDMLH